MRFSKFKQECSGILARVGKDRFGSVKLKLHDVEASSSFAQVVYDAASVEVENGAINIRPGRRSAALFEVLLGVDSLASDLGGDPDVKASGDSMFVFGYDQQQNAAIASFDLPVEEEIDESILDAPRPDMDPAVW